ncbi:MAG: hypothetical protein JWN86_513 [Planctomycetota bacterium]|nr:hypothetical protein [Planctomycetota bacterium]
MDGLTDLLREYSELLDQERRLDQRKEALRAMIQEAMAIERVANVRTEFGSAQLMARYKLTPRQDAVRGLLDRDDLLPFAQFTPAKVTEYLVPKYGRDRLVALFDIEKTEFLQIKRPPGAADDAK